MKMQGLEKNVVRMLHFQFRTFITSFLIHGAVLIFGRIYFIVLTNATVLSSSLIFQLPVMSN